MPAITHILVPTDFSAGSDHALQYARGIAAAFGASLHVLHVLENPFAPGAFMEMFTPPPGDYLEQLDREARAHLETLLTEEDRTRYSAVAVTRMGGPAEQILAYLQEQPVIDFVVMATSGRGGVSRLVMGSVTDRIVRSAPCPVLTVHPHDRGE